MHFFLSFLPFLTFASLKFWVYHIKFLSSTQSEYCLLCSILQTVPSILIRCCLYKFIFQLYLLHFKKMSYKMTYSEEIWWICGCYPTFESFYFVKLLLFSYFAFCSFLPSTLKLLVLKSV